MTQVFYTIGHSNRSIEEFYELLEEHNIAHVVDVRKLPGSKRYPHFNADTLGNYLAEHDVQFSRSARLTGRRKVSKDIPFQVNAWWQNRSFHNYADHALSQEFHEALRDLESAAPKPRRRLCVPRRSGGVVTVGSSPTICWCITIRWNTFWAPVS